MSCSEPQWRIVKEENNKNKLLSPYFKKALNEPHKHIIFICLLTCLWSPSISNVCFSSFLFSLMKWVSFIPPPAPSSCLPPFSTYLSFLFCPFCFPAKLLNSSSVGCWYHRRLRTKEERWGISPRKHKESWHNDAYFKVLCYVQNTI